MEVVIIPGQLIVREHLFIIKLQVLQCQILQILLLAQGKKLFRNFRKIINNLITFPYRVGVEIDLTKGTLQFFVNDISLGYADSFNLKEKDIKDGINIAISMRRQCSVTILPKNVPPTKNKTEENEDNSDYNITPDVSFIIFLNL